MQRIEPSHQHRLPYGNQAPPPAFHCDMLMGHTGDTSAGVSSCSEDSLLKQMDRAAK